VEWQFARRNSLNQKLLDRAARDAGAEITPIRLLGFEMPIYDGEAENGVPKGARALQALVTHHDGL
jgi:NAD(P)H-dependent FMN reductase